MPDLFIKDGDNFVAYSGPKLIPESDLMAVKTQLSTVQSELADAKSNADTSYQRAIKAEADVTTLKADIEPLRTKAGQVDTLTQQVTSLTQGKTEMETKLLGTRRQELVTKYHLAPEKAKELDTMDSAALEGLDKTLSTFGGTPPANPSNPGSNPSRFDNGGGGGGTQSPARGRDLIKEALRETADT